MPFIVGNHLKLTGSDSAVRRATAELAGRVRSVDGWRCAISGGEVSYEDVNPQIIDAPFSLRSITNHEVSVPEWDDPNYSHWCLQHWGLEDDVTYPLRSNSVFVGSADSAGAVHWTSMGTEGSVLPAFRLARISGEVELPEEPRWWSYTSNGSKTTAEVSFRTVATALPETVIRVLALKYPSLAVTLALLMTSAGDGVVLTYTPPSGFALGVGGSSGTFDRKEVSINQLSQYMPRHEMYV